MITGTSTGLRVTATATLLDPDALPNAWAERLVRKDPDLRWMLGNYVEAGRANSNGHIFRLVDLPAALKTLHMKALNMLHKDQYTVGSFAGAQLLDSLGGPLTDEAVAEMVAAEGIPTADNVTDVLPYAEAVAGMWVQRFPDEYAAIKRANADGNLYFSMEAAPKDITCPTCDLTTPWAGYESDTYCSEMQGLQPKILNEPSFGGGAVIIPPVKPGWGGADIKSIEAMIASHQVEAEQLYKLFAAQSPHLEPKEWEALMAQVLLLDKSFSTEQRQKLAKRGFALPDGSYPIETVSDLRNAIHAIGRAKDPSKARSHIKKRAKQLGHPEMIPVGW